MFSTFAEQNLLFFHEIKQYPMVGWGNEKGRHTLNLLLVMVFNFVVNEIMFFPEFAFTIFLITKIKSLVQVLGWKEKYNSDLFFCHFCIFNSVFAQ